VHHYKGKVQEEQPLSWVASGWWLAICSVTQPPHYNCGVSTGIFRQLSSYASILSHPFFPYAFRLTGFYHCVCKCFSVSHQPSPFPVPWIAILVDSSKFSSGRPRTSLLKPLITPKLLLESGKKSPLSKEPSQILSY
jgi:hypothetical protein